MNVKFKDISRGVVEARASVEVVNGVYINEVAIIRKGRDVEVELPQKSFKDSFGKVHFVEILSFESEQKRIIWTLEIKDAYLRWRETNKPVLVYNHE